jgi:hypothetical protein
MLFFIYNILLIQYTPLVLTAKNLTTIGGDYVAGPIVLDIPPLNFLLDGKPKLCAEPLPG